MNNRTPPTAKCRSSAPRYRVARLGVLATSSLAAMLSAMPAHAQQTRAGVIIDNTATASFDDASGTTTSVTSNTVSLRVDEVIDVAVASADSGDIATTPGATGTVLTFRITNTGNGDEAFRLTANGAVTGDAFDPATATIALDSDGNGVYDPTIDQTYVVGTNDPLIAAEAAITIFVITSTPSGIADGGRALIDLTATATTGTGPAGTLFAGQGAGGGDAVIGASTGDGDARGALRVSAATVDFVKSARVSDQYGGSSALPGATITYTLVARTTGSGNVANLRIADAIPAGTTYTPATLTLDGTPLTDAADGDAGRFAADRIAVALGTVPGGTQHTVTFNVRIN